MKSEEWLVLLQEQKNLIGSIQRRISLISSNYQNLELDKLAIETLSQAIALYKTLQYEYHEACQQEAEEKLDASEAMAAAAYLAHWEHVIMPDQDYESEEEPDWLNESDDIRHGWHQVAKAVMFNAQSLESEN